MISILILLHCCKCCIWRMKCSLLSERLIINVPSTAVLTSTIHFLCSVINWIKAPAAFRIRWSHWCMFKGLDIPPSCREKCKNKCYHQKKNCHYCKIYSFLNRWQWLTIELVFIDIVSVTIKIVPGHLTHKQASGRKKKGNHFNMKNPGGEPGSYGEKNTG